MPIMIGVHVLWRGLAAPTLASSYDALATYFLSAFFWLLLRRDPSERRTPLREISPAWWRGIVITGRCLGVVLSVVPGAACVALIWRESGLSPDLAYYGKALASYLGCAAYLSTVEAARIDRIRSAGSAPEVTR
ncbi:MAG: hypothetical protein R3F20_02180 [Planctomycetota bacterium]